VYTFGEGYRGQLGHGNDNGRTVPTLVSGELQGRVAVAVSAGHVSTAVVMQSGQLYTFGSGDATGHGTRDPQNVPKLVAALHGKQVVSLSTNAHGMAITGDGECYIWGRCSAGVLGRGDGEDCWSPQLLNEGWSTLAEKCVVAVAARRRHSAVLTAEGDLFTWGGGGGNVAALGQGSSTFEPEHICWYPRSVPPVDGIPWSTKTVNEAENDGASEHLPRTYTEMSTLMRGTNVSYLDDDALVEFDEQIAGVHDCVDTFCNELVAKRTSIMSELNRRRCAEEVATALPDFLCPISQRRGGRAGVVGWARSRAFTAECPVAAAAVAAAGAVEATEAGAAAAAAAGAEAVWGEEVGRHQCRWSNGVYDGGIRNVWE
jgi:hypothetical protein